MDIETFEQREQMLKLRERVLKAEQERIEGQATISLSEARRLRETPNSETLAAFKEVEEMKKNPTLGKSYTNVDEMMEALLK